MLDKLIPERERGACLSHHTGHGQRIIVVVAYSIRRRIARDDLEGPPAKHVQPLGRVQDERATLEMMAPPQVVRASDVWGDRLEMQWPTRRRKPLVLSGVRGAEHANIPVTPRLLRDPLDRVIPIIGFIEVWSEHAIRVESAAAVDEGNHVAALRQSA